MKAKFNFFYDGQPITRSYFEDYTPECWQHHLDENGVFSYGLFRAVRNEQ